MTNIKRKKRTHYNEEFKERAVDMAKEIGVSEAATKLDINQQTLSSWFRYSKKIEENAKFAELEKLRAETKRLKKELDIERRSVAILKDAARFFCLNQEK